MSTYGYARTSTQIKQGQLCNLGAALTFAFNDACEYKFHKLPFQTQMELEDKLARIVRRGTTDLMASAVTVVEAWADTVLVEHSAELARIELRDLEPTVGIMKLAIRYRLPAGYSTDDVLRAVAADDTI